MPEITHSSENRIENAVHSYGAMIFRICLSMLGSLPNAEDAVQETFLRYVDKAPSFQDSGHEKAWLIRVAINHCKNLRGYLQRHAPVAIAAAVLLLLAGGTLLPGLLSPNHSFTITAYALDANGETVSAELSAENISFDFDSNPYMASSGGFGSGGETNTSVSFSCVGENIKNITYTAEGCLLAHRIFVDNYEQWLNWPREGNIVHSSWTGLTEKGQGSGEIVFGLSDGYTVNYENQQGKNYLLRLPLYAIDEDYQGDYPVVMRAQMHLPSGIAYSAEEYTQRLITRSYIVKEAYITVTVKFTDGTEQQKRLRLTPLKHPELSLRDVGLDWYILRIEVVE